MPLLRFSQKLALRIHQNEFDLMPQIGEGIRHSGLRAVMAGSVTAHCMREAQVPVFVRVP